MIVTTLIAASVAAQSAPAPESQPLSPPPAKTKMACCEKMAKGEGCCCCKGKDMDEEAEGKKDTGNDLP